MANAVAITRNKIISVGTNKEVEKYRTKKTKTIDAMGKRLIPGLFDSHCMSFEAEDFTTLN
jgi:predicted amidohydrolase YtcJ